MARIKEISDKYFNHDDTAATLTEFTNQLLADETKNAEVGIEVAVPQDFVVNGTNVYQFLTDRGTGRVYEGLRSLELMSRIIRGVGQTSATLFDNNIIAFTPSDMRDASPERAFEIVVANLGLKDVHSYARDIKSHEIAAFDAFVRKIARQIKAGGFKTETHLSEALIRVKALVKSSLYTKVRR